MVFLSQSNIATDKNIESEKERKRRGKPIYTKSSIGVCGITCHVDGVCQLRRGLSHHTALLSGGV